MTYLASDREQRSLDESNTGPSGNALASIQLHVGRRCNLRCLHCYSQSGPEHREELPIDLAKQVVRDAATEGYGNLSISGGEPLMYKPLPDLLAAAKSMGMITTVTTNGMLSNSRRIASLNGVVDLIAISLDGVPETHNRMRNSPAAFETMQRHLPTLRSSGIPFGFLFTLTQYNLHELQWVAEFARDQGARSLQIHPLEEAGRAGIELVGESPDARERTVAFFEFLRIQAESGDGLHVQLDLADSVALLNHPDRVYATPAASEPERRRLADLLSPLVVEIDGTVSPLQFGFPRKYSLGNVHDDTLIDLATRWRDNGDRTFRALCREVFDEVTKSDDLPFINWYEVLARHAQRNHTTTSVPVAIR